MDKSGKSRLLGRKFAKELTREEIEKASGGYAGNAATYTHNYHGPDYDELR